MSSPDQVPKFGYKSPPLYSRWKKGQCGNPKRKGMKPTKTVVEMIEEFFASPIKIVENGEPRSCLVFEAIFMQLWIKADAGNKRAARVLLKYENFAQADRDSREANNDAGFEVELILIEDGLDRSYRNRG